MLVHMWQPSSSPTHPVWCGSLFPPWPGSSWCSVMAGVSPMSSTLRELDEWMNVKEKELCPHSGAHPLRFPTQHIRSCTFISQVPTQSTLWQLSVISPLLLLLPSPSGQGNSAQRWVPSLVWLRVVVHSASSSHSKPAFPGTQKHGTLHAQWFRN